MIPAIAPRYGGPSEAMVHMGRALQAAGVRVTVATTDADGPGGRLAVRLGERLDWRGVPTIVFRRRGGEAAKVSPSLARWLAREVRRFDVVHVHAAFSFSSAVAAAVARRHRVPYVVRPLGTLAPWSLGQKAWKKRLALGLGLRGLLRDAAAIHYTTEGERRAVEGATGLGRGVVIPLGVDPALLEPGPPAEAGPPYVVAVGRLHHKKNLPLLVEAFARVCARAPAGARLVIAGDGDPHVARDLRDVVAARALADRVDLPGWVSGEPKRRLIAGARAFALPSAQENFGIAAVEALALGVPVVVAEAVDLAPIVREAGCGWVSELAAEPLSAALLEALTDPQEAARRGARGADLVRREFRWDAVASRLIELYARVTRRA